MSESEIIPVWKYLENGDYTIIALAHTHFVDYRIFKGLFDITLVEDIMDEMVASGSVKWDGCSNWDLGEEGVLMHFCDKQAILNFANVLAFCWDWTGELLTKNWDPC